MDSIESKDDANKACQRLFLSVDVVGSTAYKHRTASDQVPAWYPFFREFYYAFPSYFRKAYRQNRADQTRFPVSGALVTGEPMIWKSLGDELLFYAEVQHHIQAELFLVSFRDALERYRQKIDSNTGLKLKASAWTAAFPLRNSEIRFRRQIDFIGPQIDIGFRLAQFASSTRLLVSCELALLLLHRNNELEFHYGGKRSLKGVLNDRGYPLIWLRVADPAQSEAEQALFQSVPNFQLKRFCEEFLGTVGLPLEAPYLPEDPAFNIAPPNYKADLRRIQLLHAQDEELEALEALHRDADNHAASGSPTEADA